MKKRFIHDVAQVGEVARLLFELQTTLACSQTALLAGDSGGLEFQTAEQRRILAELSALTQQKAGASVASDSNDKDAAADSLAELQAAATRVLHLGTVQASLLARARQRTRIISRLLAGPQAAYAAAALERNQDGAITSTRKGGRPPCRA